ncbi:MAG: TPM domain-containing protein, partial [Pseudomonadales bacterium]
MIRNVCLLLLLLACSQAVAQPEFPPLTGRVVDLADMLSPATEAHLTQLSAAHQQATSNQVVIAALPDLQGYTIETFGYQLGRAWGIGQKGEDNGVLLLIAEQERKVRIEVGYGLEGLLTDAIASNIINTVITPQFKRAQFDEGVTAGTEAIIQALGGQYQMVQRPGQNDDNSGWKLLAFIVLFFIFPNLFGGRFFGGFLLGSVLGSAGRRSSGGGFGGG